MNELVATDNGTLFNPATAKASYCSMSANTPEEKKKLFNAINATGKHLKDLVNMDLEIMHVYAETVEFVDKSDGTVTPGVRMVVIDNKGESYQTCSQGVFSSLQKMFSIYGEPSSWEKAIKVKVKQLNRGDNRNVLYLELV